MGRVTEIREPTDEELAAADDLGEEEEAAPAKNGKGKNGKGKPAAKAAAPAAPAAPSAEEAAAEDVAGAVARSEVRVITMAGGTNHEIEMERWTNPTDHEIRLSAYPNMYIIPPGGTVALPASYARAVVQAAPQLVRAGS